MPEPRKPSEASLGALKKGLQDLDRSPMGGNFYDSYERAWQAKTPEKYCEHHVHVLHLSELGKPAPLDAAEKRTRGWRFIWPRRDHQPIVFEVNRAAKDSEPKLSMWAQGPAVDEIYSHSQQLLRGEAAKKAVEVRMLSIPELQVEALWFRTENKLEDKIAPVIVPPGSEIEKLREYDLDTFFAVARQVAAGRRRTREQFDSV